MFSDLSEILQEMSMNLINNMCLKFASLKLQPHLPQTNELNRV